MSKLLYRSASMDCWIEALNCKFFSCLFLMPHKHCLGHHRWSVNLILQDFLRVVALCHVNHSMCFHGWLVWVIPFPEEMLTPRFGSRFLSSLGTSASCEQPGEALLPPKGARQEKHRAGLLPAMTSFTVALGGVVAFPVGETLFLSSAVANALGTEMLPRNSWPGLLEKWRRQVHATLGCLFRSPWQSVPQTIACIACAHGELGWFCEVLWFLLLATSATLNDVLQLKGT